ncbi:MAG: hypothetical protein WCG27_05505 [Pseudomonadota bacterium]
MKWLIFLNLLFLSNLALSQDLLGERIRKIDTHKKSVFMDRGIFHNGAIKTNSQIKAIRHSLNKEGKDTFERLVVDFTSAKVPRIYGHLSATEKKMFIDFFDTDVDPKIASFGKSKYVQNINFFPMSKELLSVEISFKNKVTTDIFYLESPGRLVIDVKE